MRADSLRRVAAAVCRPLTPFALSGADRFAIVAILATFAATSILVDPRGDFPLNDDWAYGWSVLQLLETGEFHLSDWAAANLFSQVLWGALFCSVFGFSFTVLRISTLVLAAMGAVGLYALLRQSSIAPRSAFVGTLSLIVVPSQLQLSHTFNNDVPSTALLVLAACLLLRGLTRESTLPTVAGVAVGYLAILARQSSLVLFAAYGLAVLVTRPKGIATIVRSIAPGLGGLALHAGYGAWLSAHHREPLLYGLQVRMLQNALAGTPGDVALTVVGNLSVLLLYAGLFLSPFLAFEAALGRRERGPDFVRPAAAIGALAGIALLGLGIRMPLLGNTLLTVGLGPAAASGLDSLLGEQTRGRVELGWSLATVLAAAGAAVLTLRLGQLTFRVLDRRTTREDRGVAAFALTVPALYLATISALPKQYLFDRYLIPILPFAIVAAALARGSGGGGTAKLSPSRAVPALLLLVGTAWFSVTATHDYLASHRARWLAITELQETTGAGETQIDGGFEFNGWNGGSRFETCSPGRDRAALANAAVWADFACIWEAGMREVFAFSFVPRAGWVAVAEHEYFSWQFLRPRALLTLRLDRAP